MIFYRSQAIVYVDYSKILLVIALNKDLLSIARWCCTNSLVINPDKTKLPGIGVPQITRSQPSFPPVKLLGKEIKPVSVGKDMGVTIESSQRTRDQNSLRLYA